VTVRADIRAYRQPAAQSSGRNGLRLIPPEASFAWSTLDPDIEPPYGLLLVSGPRAGDLLKASKPEIRLPTSTCPS
jgi:hypothetical protein